MIDCINLQQKLAQINEQWSPRVVGTLNGQCVKIAKIKGDFVWHKHDAEDEFFLVLEGSMRIHMNDGVIDLAKGECCVIPRGAEHKPAADEECHILLFEPASTRNTGDVTNERTVEPDDLKRV